MAHTNSATGANIRRRKSTSDPGGDAGLLTWCTTMQGRIQDTVWHTLPPMFTQHPKPRGLVRDHGARVGVPGHPMYSYLDDRKIWLGILGSVWELIVKDWFFCKDLCCVLRDPSSYGTRISNSSFTHWALLPRHLQTCTAHHLPVDPGSHRLPHSLALALPAVALAPSQMATLSSTPPRWSSAPPQLYG